MSFWWFHLISIYLSLSLSINFVDAKIVSKNGKDNSVRKLWRTVGIWASYSLQTPQVTAIQKPLLLVTHTQKLVNLMAPRWMRQMGGDDEELTI